MAEPLASHPDQVRQLFDAKAPTWSAKYSPDGRLTGRLARFAAALQYHLPPESRVLDLGCGTGELARAVAATGMRVTACDISGEMLRRAADCDPNGEVEWIRLDPRWRTLPFETATFHAVVAASVLEYVNDPAMVLGESARVLRSGGIVLCTVPNLNHPIRWLEWMLCLVERAPLDHSAGNNSSRLNDYLTYLRISRHRHSAGWWRAVAAHANLLTIPSFVDEVERLPLRLFIFKRPANTWEKQ